LWRTDREKYRALRPRLRFKADAEKGKTINRVLYDASAGFQGRERRKSGIESSGMHVLMACILEAIQRGSWVSERIATRSAAN